MALWQQGEKDRSRSYFDQAVAWTKKNDPEECRAARVLARGRRAAGPARPGRPAAARSARRPVRAVIPRRRMKRIMVDRLRVRLAANRASGRRGRLLTTGPGSLLRPPVEDSPRPVQDDLQPLPRCAPDRTRRSAVLWNPLIIDNRPSHVRHSDFAARENVRTWPEPSRAKTFVPSAETSSGAVPSPSPSVRDPGRARREIRPSRLGIELELGRAQVRHFLAPSPREVHQLDLSIRPDRDVREPFFDDRCPPPQRSPGRSIGPPPGSIRPGRSSRATKAWTAGRPTLVPAGPCWLRPTITHFLSRESDDQTGSVSTTLPNPGDWDFPGHSRRAASGPRRPPPRRKSRPRPLAAGRRHR